MLFLDDLILEVVVMADDVVEVRAAVGAGTSAVVVVL